MATIEERTANDGTTSFRVKIRIKGRPAASGTFQRKTDARAWAQQTEYEIKQGKYFKTAEAQKHTLGELVDRYSRDTGQSKRSHADSVRHLEWWKSQLGDYTLADITAPLVAEYRDKLLSGITRRKLKRSPATTNRYLAALSHAFTLAVKEWGWAEENPVLKISKCKEPRGRVRFLSDDERERLLAACRDHSDTLYAIVVLALSTGAREGEILGLRWPNVDTGRQLFILHDTKNSERRALPLQGLALQVVKDLAKVRRIDTDLLFPSRVHPDKPLAIHKVWGAAVKRAGIDDFRFHDLRHSCASYLAMSGASIPEIAAVLGHKTLQMVKRYAHLSDQHTASIVARMNQKFLSK